MSPFFFVGFQLAKICKFTSIQQIFFNNLRKTSYCYDREVTLLSLQGNQYTIYNMVLLSRDRVSASSRVGCFSDFQPENTEQSLKHSTNLHRTPCTSYNAYAFYPKCTKNRRSSERNFKNRPKNRLKSLQNRSKVSKASKIK